MKLVDMIPVAAVAMLAGIFWGKEKPEPNLSEGSLHNPIVLPYKDLDMCRAQAYVQAQELISQGQLSTKSVFYKCSSGATTTVFECVDNLTHQAICGEETVLAPER